MHRLFAPLAFVACLLAVPAAQAFTCESTLSLNVTFLNQFQDCSDTTNLAFGQETGIGLEHFFGDANDGFFTPDDYFTDLHITFNDSGVTVKSGFFISVLTDWIETISGDMKTISWVAPNFASRVIGGPSPVAYEWQVQVSGASLLDELSVTIEYTMDVPESGSLMLLAGALLPLGLVVSRRRV